MPLLGIVEKKSSDADFEPPDFEPWPETPNDDPSEFEDRRMKLLLEEPLPEMADMIREFLQNSGIACVVHADAIANLYRLPAPLSRARVYVHAEDWAEAKELVDSFFRKS